MSSFKSTEYHSLIKLPMLDIEYQSMIRFIARAKDERTGSTDLPRRYTLADLGMNKMLAHLASTVHAGNWGVDVYHESSRLEPDHKVDVELTLVLSSAPGTVIKYREDPRDPECNYVARAEPNQWHLCVANVYRDIVFPRHNPAPTPLYILTCPYLGKEV